MEKNSFANYDIMKVNKFNCIMITLIALLITGQGIVSKGVEYGISVLIATGAASLLSWIVFLLHTKKLIHTVPSAVIVTMSPVFTCLALSVMEHGTMSAKVYLIIGFSISSAALYFRKNIVMANAILINIILIAIIVFSPAMLFGQEYSIREFISRTIMIDCIALVMYFLTKWGHEYVESAIEKEKQATQLLSQLEITMEKIDNSAAVLNSSIQRSNTELSAISESSSHITTAINEISKGVEEEANGITSIVHAVAQAGEAMEQLHQLSKGIKADSDQVSSIVESSSNSMETMTVQITTIKDTVKESAETVAELEENMESINNFLSAITQIADQTNLLALNAAIEAARAGDFGKGFAVVADEVRKLAEQSSDTAKEIYQIISSTREKSKKALAKAKEGSIAVETGSQIVYQVNEGFQTIKKSFDNMDDSIEKEYEMIENINALYSGVQHQLESMAAISEEHAATTQEVLAATENQNNSIMEIVKDSNDLQKVSAELKALVNR